MAAGSKEFVALRDCLRTDPNELGRGRDVKETGKYTKLALGRAWRIEHPRLWRRYATEHESIKEEIRGRGMRLSDPRIRPELSHGLGKLPGPVQKGANEVRLLHGTKPDMVLQLLNNGPNERFSSTSGLFGGGTYLAEDAGKNDQYVTQDVALAARGALRDLHKHLYPGGDHPGKVFYLFLCRTVLGRYVATKHGDAGTQDGGGGRVFATSDRRELGYIPQVSPPTHYHALVAELGGDIHRFREFVQFRDARIFPEYLLAYQRK